MTVTILQGDARNVLPTLSAESVDCIVTSPPYWGLRDYDCEGQIGLEPTLEDYLGTMIGVCRELRRVLKPSGTFWLNIGDSYAGSGKGGNPTTSIHKKQQTNGGSLTVRDRKQDLGSLKPKDLCMVPSRLALALQADGWWLRSEIIWSKPNPMPESVTDRPTSAHEKVFLFTKSERYFYDADAVRETAYDTGRKNGRDGRAEDQRARPPGSNPRKLARLDYSVLGRNLRNVWSIASQPLHGSHFATMPPALAERCIKAGCLAGGHVLDPFGGAGTTCLVADRLGRHATLIELNQAYVGMARARIADDAGLFAAVSEAPE